MIDADLAEVLPELRANAEARMRTPCVIRRPTGTTADPLTGADVTTYAAQLVYDGSSGRPGCRIQTRESQVLLAESADASVTTQRYELHVPVGVGPVHVGDVAEVGERRFRIDGLHEKDDQTAQRLPVTETTSRAS